LADGGAGDNGMISKEQLQRFAVRGSNLAPVNRKELIKGDYVGHPFRGNQWADSSGASTVGGETSSASPSDQTLRTVAEDINSKLDVLLANGARFVQFFSGEGVDRSNYDAYLPQLPLISLNEPQAQLRANGVGMVEEAINDDGKIVVIEDKDGVISGAISMGAEPDSAETEAAIQNNLVEIGGVPPDSTWTLMKVAGSTMKVDGIGSALFASAINVAAESGSGLYLVPLDENAKDFWESKGFTTINWLSDDATDEQILNPKIVYQFLDAQSVQTIYDNLEEVF
jgi:hypothetical protein